MIAVTALATSAQQENVPENNPVAPNVPRPFKLFQELGLTKEQAVQLRTINQERKQIVSTAQIRWRIANRQLDEAIYADEATEDQIKELTRAAQFAQSELLRERTITEFRIRQVLTPEQLVKFRNLRARLAERAEQRAPNVRKNAPGDVRPIERLRQQRKNVKPE